METGREWARAGIDRDARRIRWSHLDRVARDGAAVFQVLLGDKVPDKDR